MVFPASVLSALLLAIFLVNCKVFGIVVYSLHLSLAKLNEYAGHSSFDIRYPWPICLIYLEPRDHWLHHSIEEKHYGKNYGLTISIWDKLFGSYLRLDPSRYKELRYGVKNTDYNKSFPITEMLLKPPLLAIRSLYNAFKLHT